MPWHVSLIWQNKKCLMYDTDFARNSKVSAKGTESGLICLVTHQLPHLFQAKLYDV